MFAAAMTLLGILAYAAGIGSYVGAVDRKSERYRYVLYPSGCIAVFFVPTLLILLMYGGGSPFAPEALLFHLFYTAPGLAFGLGYGLIGKMKLGRFYEKSA